MNLASFHQQGSDYTVVGWRHAREALGNKSRVGDGQDTDTDGLGISDDPPGIRQSRGRDTDDAEEADFHLLIDSATGYTLREDMRGKPPGELQQRRSPTRDGAHITAERHQMLSRYMERHRRDGGWSSASITETVAIESVLVVMSKTFRTQEKTPLICLALH